MIDSICPRFVETKILSDTVVAHLKNSGVAFATVDDAAEAAMRIVSDTGINGIDHSIIPTASSIVTGH